MSDPVAYFISWTAYGTWLHGRDPGSVDADHNTWGTPVLPGDSDRERESRAILRDPVYILDKARRAVVLETILEVAAHRKWKLWAVHVRSNHVHAIVTAACKPEKVLIDFKAYASRRLKERFGERADLKRWTEHGSTKYLWTDDVLVEKVRYVVHEQGEPMAVYDGSSEPEA